MSEGWQSLIVKEFSRLTAGGTPSTSKMEYWSNGTIPWLSSGEVHKKRIRYVDGYITEDGLKNSAAKLIPVKTLLVALAGQGKTRGTVAITEIETTTNQSIAGIIADKEICHPDYLFFNLDSRYDELRSISGGSGRAGLNLEILGNIDVSLPPLPEQKKIASILTSVDEVIETIQKQIDKLQDLKKATMNELLTKGIGHTEFKDSELGRIPKIWEVNRLNDLISQNSKITYGVVQPGPVDEDGVKFVRGGDIFDGEINTKKLRTISKKISGQYQRTKLEGGELLMSLVGYPGEVAIAPPALNGANIARQVALIKLSNQMNTKFVMYYFLSNIGKGRLFDKSVGSAQQVINLVDLKEVNVAVPPVEEQKKQVAIFDLIYGNIKLQKQKLSQTQSLKKSLMQDLLTGKVRVQVN